MLFLCFVVNKNSFLQSFTLKTDIGISTCLPFHSRWYRVSIREISDEGKYEVFHLDYGDQEEVPRNWIQPAWNAILQVLY